MARVVCNTIWKLDNFVQKNYRVIQFTQTFIAIKYHFVINPTHPLHLNIKKGEQTFW